MDRLTCERRLIGRRRDRPVGHVRAPVLSVVDRRSRVAPPQSVLPFHEAAGSRQARVLDYRGDIGVALQHVGRLVGRHAHALIWPQIVRWLHGHASAL